MKKNPDMRGYVTGFWGRPEAPPQQQAYINTEARKIRWLRGMLRWAVRLARGWRDEWLDLQAEINKSRERYYVELRLAKDYLAKNSQLRRENAALRQAGRGLLSLIAKRGGRMDWTAEQEAWRKVDPQ